MTQEEYNSMQASAREQFKQGTPLFGKEGGISSYIGRLSKLRLGRWDGKPPFSYITDKVWAEIKSWRTRSLDEVYPIVWMDAIHYKARNEKGSTEARAIYNVLGIDKYGHKDLLGMYVSHWLPWCHPKRISKDRRPVVHRAPDSQFREVRRQQEPKGVSLRPQACLWRIHFGDRFNIMW